MEDVKFGLEKWIYYFKEIANLPIVPEGPDPVKAMVDTGLAVIGTPDDAAARIQQLVDESGGFGLPDDGSHWRAWAARKQSYELFARYVAPRFQQLNENREASIAWVGAHKPEFTAQVMGAMGARIAQHIAEKAPTTSGPSSPPCWAGRASHLNQRTDPRTGKWSWRRPAGVAALRHGHPGLFRPRRFHRRPRAPIWRH